MTQKDLLQNEVIEEIFRERGTYYLSKEKDRDFWLLNTPAFLFDPKLKLNIHNTNFFLTKKKDIVFNNLEDNFEYYSCIISTNKDFINWIELRTGYFENLDEKININNEEYFFSNGLKGTLPLNYMYKNYSALFNFPYYLHPDFYILKTKKFTELYSKFIKKQLI
jgi:hypothetical protein